MSLGAKMHGVNYNDVHLSGNSCLREKKKHVFLLDQISWGFGEQLGSDNNLLLEHNIFKVRQDYILYELNIQIKKIQYALPMELERKPS